MSFVYKDPHSLRFWTSKKKFPQQLQIHETLQQEGKMGPATCGWTENLPLKSKSQGSPKICYMNNEHFMTKL